MEFDPGKLWKNQVKRRGRWENNYMRKKSVITIGSEPATIHSLNHEGIGIAHVENKVTFIEGALPGETVRYQVFKKRRHYDEGAVLEILKPSSERAKPVCSQFGVCGGCSLQHLEVSKQITWKQKILLEQLSQIGHVKPDSLLPPLSGATSGYRHKARLGVRYVEKQKKVLVGFRKKFRGQIAQVDLCHTLHPSVGARLSELSSLISDLSAYSQIPQIEVAAGDDHTALIFRHLAPLSQEDRNRLCEFGQKYQLHIYLQPNPPDPLSLLSPNEGPHRLRYRLPDFQIEMLFHPTDFTQIHLEVNRLMVKQALTLLDPHQDETVLDLFCGIGNFSLPLARYARKVVGIEGSEIMVERAYENAAHNGLSNVEFRAANLFEPPLKEAWLNQPYVKILLDPPRSGAKEIIEQFPKFQAKRIVYVSCNPATLARDASLLVQIGYRLKQVGVMNMFPQTSHVEAISVFEK